MSNNSEQKAQPIQMSFCDTREFLAEQIYDELRIPSIQFCLYSKSDGSITYVDHIELENGNIVTPVQSDALIGKKVVLLPSEPVEYQTELELINQIKEFIHIYLDLHPFYEYLVAHYILMSWRFDELSVVPYLRALGDYGSGKTRLIQTVGALCYKAMFLAGATSDAFLFRVIELFGGTLVLNELERVNTDLQSQITIILNNGYEKGMPVGRVEGDRRRLPQTFDVFCPKVISTRERFKDQALESRIISIPMKQTLRKDIPSFIGDGFWNKALELRNRLLMYRFMHFGEMVYTEVEQEAKREKLAFLEPRIKQTLLPIFYVITDQELEQQFLDYAREYQQQLITDRGSEISALVFEKLNKLFKENRQVAVKQVTEEVNQEIELERKYTSQKIGKIIRDGLGFKTQRGTGGLFYIVYNEKQIQHLISRYGIESSPTSSNSTINSNMEVDLVNSGDLPSHLLSYTQEEVIEQQQKELEI